MFCFGSVKLFIALTFLVIAVKAEDAVNSATTFDPAVIILISMTVILAIIFLILLIWFIVVFCLQPGLPPVDVETQTNQSDGRPASAGTKKYKTDINNEDEESSVPISKPRRSHLHKSPHSRYGHGRRRRSSRSLSRHRSSRRRSSRDYEQECRPSRRPYSRSSSRRYRDDRASSGRRSGSRSRRASHEHYRSSRRNSREYEDEQYPSRHRSRSGRQSRSRDRKGSRLSGSHKKRSDHSRYRDERDSTLGTGTPSVSSTKSFELRDHRYDSSISDLTMQEQSTSESASVVKPSGGVPADVMMNPYIHQELPPPLNTQPVSLVAQQVPQQQLVSSPISQLEKDNSGSSSTLTESNRPHLYGSPQQAASSASSNASQRFIHYQQQKVGSSMPPLGAPLPPAGGAVPVNTLPTPGHGPKQAKGKSSPQRMSTAGSVPLSGQAQPPEDSAQLQQPGQQGQHQSDSGSKQAH